MPLHQHVVAREGPLSSPGRFAKQILACTQEWRRCFRPGFGEGYRRTSFLLHSGNRLGNCFLLRLDLARSTTALGYLIRYVKALYFKSVDSSMTGSLTAIM